MTSLTNKIMLSQAHELIEEVLNNEGEIVLTVMGNSMFPMLRNKKDSVCIVKVKDKVLKSMTYPFLYGMTASIFCTELLV